MEGSSEKFWAIELEDTVVKVHFGRIGTKGQCKEKDHDSESAAKKEYDKLISSKVKKGYQEVEASDQAMPAPVASSPRKSKKSEDSENQDLGEEAEAPAVESVEESQQAEPISFPEEIVRSLDLDPRDYQFVSWRQRDVLTRPEPPAFNLQDCLKRLRAVGRSWYSLNWEKAKIPENPSREEAHFWLVAHALVHTGRKTPAEVAGELETMTFNGDLTFDQVVEIVNKLGWSVSNCFACVAALSTPSEILGNQELTSHSEGIRRFVIPFLSEQQRQDLIQLVRPHIDTCPPAGNYDGFTRATHLAAWLGAHDEIEALIASFPDKYYIDSVDYLQHYHEPVWVLFGLRDRESVLVEAKRLGVKLRTEEEARAWLAVTEYEGLDLLAQSVELLGDKEEATRLAKVLERVSAPEAAVAAMQIVMNSKAPQVGMTWLNKHPLETAVGLAKVASGNGKLAQKAKEQLLIMSRSDGKSALEAAQKLLSEPEAEWLQREILESEEASLELLTLDAMPETLREALKGKGKNKIPDWLAVAALPPVKVQGHRLSDEHVEKVLAALKATALGEEHPLITALKSHSEPNSLNQFAWSLFELWMSFGAISKEKWALGAVGHLGGDDAVLRLTPLLREWPGQSQHQRAVFGLQCLRAVGSDTALMALNGIAQKLKFQGLKNKAKELMEEIASARGMTREELADRIVPDCGLDETGSRVFDFGPRQFKVVLGGDLKPAVRDDQGKVKPNLPKPNKSDDPELAEVATAEWKLLKKTLKEALKVQATRLEEAMITGRRWNQADFEAFLVKHPLMINLVRLVVWGIYDEKGKVLQSFRVTEDRTYADENDDDVELSTEGQIGVIHPAHLGEESKSNWGQILSDYEIVPPFQQLGRSIFHPEPEDVGKTEITRYMGPKIPGIALYGILERTLWVKDTPADGGGFHQHSKYFPFADITAFIQYDPGLSMGYYDEEQQLAAVYFVKGYIAPDWWGHHTDRIKIEKVDLMVLSEVLRMAELLVSKAQ